MAPVHADVSARIEDRRSGVTENAIPEKRPQNFFEKTRPTGSEVADSAAKVTLRAGKPPVPLRTWLTPETVRVSKSDPSGRLGAWTPARRRVRRRTGLRFIDVHVSRFTISVNRAGPEDGNARDVETPPEVAGLGRTFGQASPPCPVTSRSSDSRLCEESSKSIAFVSRSRQESRRGRRSRHRRPSRRCPRIRLGCHSLRRRRRRHFRRCR
jgi:hypothetical protein